MEAAAAPVATVLLLLRLAVMAVSHRAQHPEAAVTERKMNTNPAVAMAATAVVTVTVVMAVEAVVVVVATETADLEVVTNPVATAVAPATRVVIITKKIVVKWSLKRIRSSSKE